MTTAHPVSNPFALMMEPESVLAAIAASDRLARLRRRIFRPLDRPMIGSPACSEEHTALGDLDESSDVASSWGSDSTVTDDRPRQVNDL